jgi:hypothetical protein
VAHSFAASAAGYTGSTVTALSKRIRRVAAAAAASTTKALGVPVWKKTCSPQAR